MNNTDGYHGTEEQKKLAAFKAAGEIQDNMILGLGTGSTVYHLIVKMAERVRGGLSIHAAATSARTEELAAHYGIPLIPFHGAQQIHLATAWTPLTRTSIPLRAVAARCSGKR